MNVPGEHDLALEVVNVLRYQVGHVKGFQSHLATRNKRKQGSELGRQGIVLILAYHNTRSLVRRFVWENYVLQLPQ